MDNDYDVDGEFDGGISDCSPHLQFMPEILIYHKLKQIEL